MKHFLALSALALGVFATARPAFADDVFSGSEGGSITLTVTTTNGTVNVPVFTSGWYDNSGSHNSENTNYYAGALGPTLHNNFFTFDLSSLDGTVESASVALFNYNIDGNPLYTLRDVSTSPEILAGDNSGAIGIFNDLGSGVVYGSHQYDPLQSNSTSTIILNAAAVAAINGHEGSFLSFGGSTTNASVTPTPEPSTLLLAGPALAGLGIIRRRLKRA